MNTASQKLAIQRHLSKPGNSITRLEAIKRFGCINLPGRMYDLKEDGFTVLTERLNVGRGKWVARYSFAMVKR